MFDDGLEELCQYETILPAPSTLYQNNFFPNRSLLSGSFLHRPSYLSRGFILAPTCLSRHAVVSFGCHERPVSQPWQPGRDRRDHGAGERRTGMSLFGH